MVWYYQLPFSEATAIIMETGRHWGATVGNVIAGGIAVVLILFTLALVLAGVAALISAWRALIGA